MWFKKSKIKDSVPPPVVIDVPIPKDHREEFAKLYTDSIEGPGRMIGDIRIGGTRLTLYRLWSFIDNVSRVPDQFKDKLYYREIVWLNHTMPVIRYSMSQDPVNVKA